MTDGSMAPIPGRAGEPDQRLRATRRKLLAAELRLTEIGLSRSWTFTAPLRRIAARQPGIAQAAWTIGRAAVWLLAGQLPRRVRAWRHRFDDMDGPPLASAPPPAAEPGRRRPTLGHPSILIVDYRVPRPDRGAGDQHTMCVIETLVAEGWSVAFWPYDRGYLPGYSEQLEQAGVWLIDQRDGGDFTAWMTSHGSFFDHVLLMRPVMSLNLLPVVVETTDAVISYEGHDLHHVRLRMEAREKRDPDLADRATRMLARERTIWRVADIVTYPTQEEADAVRALEPSANAFAVPFNVFPDPVPRTEVPPEPLLLFVGGFAHRPNPDAMLWFASELLPLIRQAFPTVRLVIAGSDPPPEVQALRGEDVEVTGFISTEALNALYRRARVAIAPLRFGAGVKGKVVEAMWAGVPVVTTPVGTQGLPGLEGIVPAVWDKHAFARAVTVLLADDAAWSRQSAAQTAYIEAEFSRARFRDALLTALRSVV